MWCVKCRKKTKTNNEQKSISKNGRPMLTGECGVCGTTKNQFLPGKAKKQTGDGIFNDYILPRLPELHYISPFTLKKFNFAGPGTKLDKRLDPRTKLPLPNSQPVNEVDKAAYYHDLAYENMKDQASRNIADDVMIQDLDAIRKDKKTNWKTRGDALLVGLAMKAKRWLGMGKKKKPVKKTRGPK
jgi:hypothetical protein